MRTHKRAKIYIVVVFAGLFAIMVAQCFTTVSAWIKLNEIPLTQKNDNGENGKDNGAEEPFEPVVLEFSGMPACFKDYECALVFLSLNNGKFEEEEWLKIWGDGAYVMFYADNMNEEDKNYINAENNIGNEISIYLINSKDSFKYNNYTIEDGKIPHILLPGEILIVSDKGFFEVFPAVKGTPVNDWPEYTPIYRPAHDVIIDIDDIDDDGVETAEGKEEDDGDVTDLILATSTDLR